MSINADNSMIEIFVHETENLIGQLEMEMIAVEKSGEITSSIDDIFRIMHTIKGNSMMMDYGHIGRLAHSLEDLFDFLRSNDFRIDDYTHLIDLILASMDYFKIQTALIQQGATEFVAEDKLEEAIKQYLSTLKQTLEGRKEVTGISFKALTDFEPMNMALIDIKYDENAMMEEVRAFSTALDLQQVCSCVFHVPQNLEESSSGELIRSSGFKVLVNSAGDKEQIEALLAKDPYIKTFNLQIVEEEEFKSLHRNGLNKEATERKPRKRTQTQAKPQAAPAASKSNYISVKVDYLDSLLNLVGEIVISESMVSRNKDIEGLKLENFERSVEHLRKNIGDLQDVVMALRMVPLTNTFQKMHRIVRDICSATGKKVELVFEGEDTYVDKTIVENISDPLMHLIRNAVDHGIEMPEDRTSNDKDETGRVVLSARKSGGDIFITISDDGGGMDASKIFAKAKEKGIADKPFEDYSPKEIYEFIFEPGFSTKEAVTGFSGRGVGMDVVKTDLKKIGGSVGITTELGKGSTFRIKIPMSLAIIDGMILKIGQSKMIVPTSSIRETIKITEDNVSSIDDTNYAVIRGEAFPIVKLHEKYEIETNATSFEDGIMIIIDNADNKICMMADEILGEHQVVVKKLSSYLDKVEGVSGAALLGSGEITIILDPAEITIGKAV